MNHDDISKWISIIDSANNCNTQDPNDFVNNDGQFSPQSLSGTINEDSKSYTVTMTPDDISILNQSEFDHLYTTKGDQVTFTTDDPQALVSDLESIIDAGETTWADIMGVDVDSSNFDFDDDVESDDVDTNDLGDASMSDGEEDVSDLIAQIDMAQAGGMSMSNVMFPIGKLYTMPAERVKRIYNKVMGEGLEEDYNMEIEFSDPVQEDTPLGGDPIQYRDPEGRFIVMWDVRRGYRAIGKKLYANEISRVKFDNLEDAIEHAELEIQGYMDENIYKESCGDLNEEASDAIRDFMAMGYSRSQAEDEARKMYPNEFPSRSNAMRAPKKYQIMVDGRPLKIKGQLVRSADPRKTIQKLSSMPFNKGKKFTAESVELNEDFKVGDTVELCPKRTAGGKAKITAIDGDKCTVNGKKYNKDVMKLAESIQDGAMTIIDEYFPKRPDEGRYGTERISDLVRDMEEAGWSSTPIGAGEIEFYHPESHCVVHVHKHFGDRDKHYAWCEEPDAEPPVKGEANPMETTTAGGIASGPARVEENEFTDWDAMRLADEDDEEESPEEGEYIDHPEHGSVEVLEITETDAYGQPAEYLVQKEDGTTMKMDHDYLLGYTDLNNAEDSEPVKEYMETYRDAIQFLQDEIDTEEQDEDNPELIATLEEIIEMVESGEVSSLSDMENITTMIHNATGDIDHSESISRELCMYLGISLDESSTEDLDDRTPEFQADQATAKRLFNQTAGDERSIAIVARKMGKKEDYVRDLLDETISLDEDNYVEYVKRMMGYGK